MVHPGSHLGGIGMSVHGALVRPLASMTNRCPTAISAGVAHASIIPPGSVDLISVHGAMHCAAVPVAPSLVRESVERRQRGPHNRAIRCGRP